MANKLTTPANRARIPRGKRVIDVIAPGIALVYRRGKASNSDATWSVRSRVRIHAGDGSPYELASIGLADDLTAADGGRWLSYKQAVELALHKAREMDRDAKATPLSVGEAVQTYIERRRARGTGRPGDDETALRKYLGSLGDKRVAGLEHGMLLVFAHRSPRHACRSLRAALNATPHDIRPSNVVLSALREHRPQQRREQIEAVMSQAEVEAMVAGARRYDRQFGLLIEVLASTGVRPSQATRCRVGDLRVREDVQVVPASFKGKDPTAPKPVSRLPLPAELMHELAAWAAGKPDDALLFALPLRVRQGRGWRVAQGEVRPWTKQDWADAAKAAGISSKWRTYDLRHARIVRLILAGVPIGAIADKLDTSVKMIEHTYARWIGSTTDDLFRAALPKRRKLAAVA
jgi:integrase